VPELQLVSGIPSAPLDILSLMNSNAHASTSAAHVLRADEVLSIFQLDFPIAGDEGPSLTWFLDSALNEALGCIPP
jgi:hypothetical protein